jgi:hypothetical protein
MFKRDFSFFAALIFSIPATAKQSSESESIDLDARLVRARGTLEGFDQRSEPDKSIELHDNTKLIELDDNTRFSFFNNFQNFRNFQNFENFRNFQNFQNFRNFHNFQTFNNFHNAPVQTFTNFHNAPTAPAPTFNNFHNAPTIPAPTFNNFHNAPAQTFMNFENAPTFNNFRNAPAQTFTNFSNVPQRPVQPTPPGMPHPPATPTPPVGTALQSPPQSPGTGTGASPNCEAISEKNPDPSCFGASSGSPPQQAVAQPPMGQQNARPAVPTSQTQLQALQDLIGGLTDGFDSLQPMRPGLRWSYSRVEH